MSAGLDTSTVTPGRTAPDASLTLPATVPSTWAPAADGRISARKVATTRNQARALSCIARSSACEVVHCRAKFRLANLFSIGGWRLYAPHLGLSRTSATDTVAEKTETVAGKAGWAGRAGKGKALSLPCLPRPLRHQVPKSRTARLSSRTAPTGSTSGPARLRSE